FYGCGVLVQNGECLRFQDDAGRQHFIQNTAGFHAGERVLVDGPMVVCEGTPSCVSPPDGSCIVNNTIEACEAFMSCGLLVDHVDCVLFQADDPPGGVYLLENYGGFVVGDRVRVDGVLTRSCINVCFGVCIVLNTVERCGLCACDWNHDGVLNTQDFFDFL